MDDETADLIFELCSHAGGLMEDASVLAISLPAVAPADRLAALRKLIGIVEQMNWLLHGALGLELRGALD